VTGPDDADPTDDPGPDGSPAPAPDGSRRVRGALGRLVRKGQAEIPESEDPQLLLWQLEQFTDRVVRRNGADSVEAARARMELSLQLAKLGKWHEAQLLREDGFATLSRHRGEDDPETLQTEVSLAVALAHTGRGTEAEAHLEHAASAGLDALGPDHEVTGLARRRLDEFRQGRADPPAG